MRTMLLVTAIAALAFAGCVQDTTEGYTAKEAAETLKAEAATWAEDAVFLGLFGIESPGELPLGAGSVADVIGSQADPTPGDGALPAWGGAFYSASQASLAVFAVDSEGVRNAFTMNSSMSGGLPPGFADAAAQGETTWTVDSPAAIAAVRSSNATLEAAFASGNVTVYYALDLIDDVRWHVGGQAGAVSFQAGVDLATGEVQDLQLSDEPLPPVTGPLPVNEGPLPPPITQTGHTQASADPLNFAMQPPCSSPTHQCVEIPFNTTRAVTIDATLSWGNQANDYDFYVLDSTGTSVLTGASPPGVLGPEDWTGELEAGDYIVQIVPWSVVNDDWTFTATFS